PRHARCQRELARAAVEVQDAIGLHSFRLARAAAAGGAEGSARVRAAGTTSAAAGLAGRMAGPKRRLGWRRGADETPRMGAAAQCAARFASRCARAGPSESGCQLVA